MAYSLRDRNIQNYKELADGPRLPRRRREKAVTQRLYPEEVLDEDSENHRVKVHYIGYSAEHDEWVKEEDTVDSILNPPLKVWQSSKLS